MEILTVDIIARPGAGEAEGEPGRAGERGGAAAVQVSPYSIQSRIWRYTRGHWLGLIKRNWFFSFRSISHPTEQFRYHLSILPKYHI